MRQKVNVDQTFLPKETLEWITELFLNPGLFKEWSPTLKERLDRMMCHCTPCSHPQFTEWHGSGQLRGHMKGNSTLRSGHLCGCICKMAAHIWAPSGVQAEVCTWVYGGTMVSRNSSVWLLGRERHLCPMGSNQSVKCRLHIKVKSLG